MKSLQDSSDIELLRLMQAGDEQAFVHLFRRRQPGIYRFALQMCGSRELAEDVTQDVFMVLIRGAETFEASRGSLSAFLYGTARNQLLRRLQRERFYDALDEEASDLPETSEGPASDIDRNETILAVRKAVLSLPERYREVVVLCDMEEMSYAEAAEILSCAVGTVRSRLHRGRALLVEKLRPEKEKANADALKSARCFA